jgi:hypothetical protein
MSDLSPLSGEERKCNFGAVRSVDDPYRTYTLRPPFRVPFAALSCERNEPQCWLFILRCNTSWIVRISCTPH